MGGCPLGDIGALNSMNVAATALIGRVFLSETLTRFHLAAVGCSGIGHSTLSFSYVRRCRGLADLEAPFFGPGTQRRCMAGLRLCDFIGFVHVTQFHLRSQD